MNRRGKRSGVARPAAEIEHPLGALEQHLRQQIARRPRAIVFELEILASGPVVYQRGESEVE